MRFNASLNQVRFFKKISIGAPAGIRTRDKRLETSCDNPFTTGAQAGRSYSITKPIRSSRSLIKKGLVRINMMMRQRLGVILMILFLPINGPLWRMTMQEFWRPIPLGELQFLGLSLALFLIGAILTFASGNSSTSEAIE